MIINADYMLAYKEKAPGKNHSESARLKKMGVDIIRMQKLALPDFCTNETHSVFC